MQTFKQYLREDEHNPKGYDLSPYIVIETSIHRDEAEDYGFENDGEIPAAQQMEGLTDDFKQHFNNNSIDCFFDSDSLFTITIDTSSYSKSHVEGVSHDLMEYLRNELDDKLIQAHRIELSFREEIPANLRSDYDVISFYLPWAKPFTLKAIDKHFPNARLIHFYKPSKIIGNVLGLLKIKSLQQLTWEGQGVMPEWLKIINDHLLSPERSIMDCQEELMDAGLEEYAQL